MSEDPKPGGPDAGSENQPEGADEAKSLTELLAEWDDDDSTVEKDDGKPSADEQREARITRMETRENQRDMDALVERVKGDLDVDNWVVQAWVLNEAANNPKMDALWDNRETRKADLDKIVNDALIPGFKKYAEDKILPPEPDPKDDPPKKGGQRKLAAAVKGARESKTTTGGSFDDVDWGTLPDGEFQAKKQDVFKAAAAGKLK